MIGYTPHLRRGDLALNAILYRRGVLGERSLGRSSREIRGLPWKGLNLFGNDAKALAASVYGDASFAPIVATNNSLFGLYMSCLTTRDQHSFLESAHDEADPLVFPRICGTAEHNRLRTSFLRSCIECTETDLEVRGHSCWRVVHQVPFLNHCPHHECALTEWSNFPIARASYIGGISTPDDLSVSGKVLAKEIEPSDGYSGYLKLWKQLADRGIKLLAIDQWSSLVSSVTDDNGGMPSLVAQVEESIVRRWGANSAAVGRMLGVEKRFSIASELSLDTQPQHLARRLVVLDALKDLQLVDDTEDAPFQQRLSLNRNYHKLKSSNQCSDTTTTLLNIAFRLKLRPSIATSLLKNSKLAHAAHMAGHPSEYQIYAVINECPDALLESIDCSFGSKPGNWAQRALDRRRRVKERGDDVFP